MHAAPSAQQRGIPHPAASSSATPRRPARLGGAAVSGGSTHADADPDAVSDSHADADADAKRDANGGYRGGGGDGGRCGGGGGDEAVIPTPRQSRWRQRRRWWRWGLVATLPPAATMVAVRDSDGRGAARLAQPWRATRSAWTDPSSAPMALLKATASSLAWAPLSGLDFCSPGEHVPPLAHPAPEMAAATALLVGKYPPCDRRGASA